MRKEVLFAGALACVLSMPLVGCGDMSSTSSSTNDSTTAQEQTGDFDAVEAYWGQWRGSVETTGESIYGSTSGNEQMLDINLGQDGTCTVEPLETHADLLSDEGTWEGTESEITLHLSDRDIVLTVVDSAALEGTASDFDIADFETINFAFYG